jgi:hypothetical protein
VTEPRLICDHCADVIGVYEPVVVVSDCEVRNTSRAAEPALGLEHGELYHRACYLERFGSVAS